ncbi:MAG TPA: DUF3108 domain-containing protein, partial [Kofleriaceae bacterium]
MRPILLAGLALTGCAGAEAMSLPQQPAAMPVVETTTSELGFYPGETMAFEVKLAGMTAGEAQLAVGAVGESNGRKALVVTSRAETAGAAKLLKSITDEATTIIDVETGRPLQLDTQVTMNDKVSTATAKFTGSTTDVTYTKPGETAQHTYHADFGKVIVFDSHSAMAQLRGWHAKPGTTKQVFVVGGRRLWRVDVHFIATETIGSALGNRASVHLTGEAYRVKPNLATEQPNAKAARTFDVWISDDNDRVPLKMTAKTELGDVEMDLTDYNRP